jgi:sugar phosphate isomerase/epimerase
MKLGVSNIPSIPLLKEIDLISQLGFDYLELYIGRSKTTLSELRKEMKKILDAVSNKNLELVGHLTNYNISIWNENPDMLLDCLDLYADLNIRLATLHTRVETKEGQVITGDEYVSEVMNSVLGSCLTRADEYGITLCTENTDESTEDLVKLLNEFPKLGFTLDIGHSNLDSENNTAIPLLDALGDRLEHIHCHDNLGGYGEKWDLHLPIGVGNIDFKSIFNRLHSMNYDKRITLEILARDRESYLEISKEKIMDLWTMK